MPVLLYDPAEKKHVLQLKDGPWAGKRWSVDLLVCNSPFCGCFDIHFECILADAERDAQPASVRFSLDTQKQSIFHPPGRGASAISDSLAEAVMRELGEAGWKYLYEYLLGEKQEQIENCDPKHRDADFPPEVLRGDTTVVGYAEIFPLSPALTFRIDSRQWLAVDDYCVNPDCDCRRAILQFITDDHKRGLSNSHRKIPPAMHYDYKEGTFEEEQAPEAHQPSLPALLAGVQGQWPGFDTEVKKRHKLLRALFRRASRKYQAAAERGRPAGSRKSAPPPRPEPKTLPMTKPGRNDPCSCGSGRKYKKCCGG